MDHRRLLRLTGQLHRSCDQIVVKVQGRSHADQYASTRRLWQGKTWRLAGAATAEHPMRFYRSRMVETRPTIDLLREAAQSVLGGFELPAGATAGTCAAALQTESGDIFTGVCVDLACGLGFCAEQAAVGAMLTTRQTRVVALLAVNARGLATPCGRCRELLSQLDPENLDAVVWVERGPTPLRILLPDAWAAQRGR